MKIRTRVIVLQLTPGKMIFNSWLRKCWPWLVRLPSLASQKRGEINNMLKILGLNLKIYKCFITLYYSSTVKFPVLNDHIYITSLCVLLDCDILGVRDLFLLVRFMLPHIYLADSYPSIRSHLLWEAFSGWREGRVTFPHKMQKSECP